MDNPNDTIARLTKERETSRAAGDALARGVSQFIRKYELQDAELVLKKLLYEYMKVEALVDRDIYKEMAVLERESHCESCHDNWSFHMRGCPVDGCGGLVDDQCDPPHCCKCFKELPDGPDGPMALPAPDGSVLQSDVESKEDQ